MNTLILFTCSIILILVGSIRIFNPDLSWSITRYENDFSGVKSKRNSNWDKINLITGYFFLIAGVLSFIFLLWFIVNDAPIEKKAPIKKKNILEEKQKEYFDKQNELLQRYLSN